MTLMSKVLAMTPYEPKRKVAGRVVRHYIDVRLRSEGNKSKLERILYLRIEGEAHPFQVELERFPDAAWTAAGDAVAFEWQDRNRKAHGFQLVGGRDRAPIG